MLLWHLVDLLVLLHLLLLYFLEDPFHHLNLLGQHYLEPLLDLGLLSTPEDQLVLQHLEHQCFLLVL